MPRLDRLKPIAVIAALVLPLSAAALAQDKAVPQSQLEMQLSFSPLVKQTRGAVVNVYAERLVQRRHNARLLQHIERTAGALDGFFLAQHIGPARRHQHQVVKTHDFHGAGGGAHIASMAGVDQDKTGLHGRAEREDKAAKKAAG